MHVERDRRHFGPDREHVAGPVGVTHEIAGERPDVVLGIGAEGPGSRVGDGHLRETPHEQQRDQRADHITHEHAGTGETDREAAAEKEPGADRAADGDHGHAACGEVPPQAALALDDVVEAALTGAHVPPEH